MLISRLKPPWPIHLELIEALVLVNYGRIGARRDDHTARHARRRSRASQIPIFSISSMVTSSAVRS